MIYTLGHEKSYRKAIADNNGVPLQKLGKREPCDEFPKGYEGGCSFKTFEEAEAANKKYYPGRGFIVWGLDTTWENTSQGKDSWNDLIKDCDIVPLLQVSVR